MEDCLGFEFRRPLVPSSAALLKSREKTHQSCERWGEGKEKKEGPEVRDLVPHIAILVGLKTQQTSLLTILPLDRPIVSELYRCDCNHIIFDIWKVIWDFRKVSL